MDTIFSNVTFCIVLVVLIVAVSHIYEGYINELTKTHDSIVSTMLSIYHRNVEIFWFIVWMSISALLGILLPFISKSNDLSWFGKPVGLLITFNYTVIVPMLVGSYVGLIKNSKKFFKKENLNSLGIDYFYDENSNFIYRKTFWRVITKAILFSLTIVITYAAIKSIIHTESVEELRSPWADGSSLTLQGVFYYALRGINAYLALGLIFTSLGLFVLFTFILINTDKYALLDSRFRVKPQIHSLTTSLAACAFLGPLVTVLHGIALIREEKLVSPASGTFTLLVDSTWIYWAVLAFLSTCFLLLGIIWFYRHVQEAVVTVRDRLEDEVDQLYNSRDPSIENFSAKLDAFEKINTRINIRKTSPIPKRAAIFVSGSFLIQILNVLATLKNFY